MGATRSGWRLTARAERSLPPLAWLARIERDRATVDVTCGSSVRSTDSSVFEGTWSGDLGIDDLGQATTVYGSGVVVDAGGPLVITPSHTAAGVFAVHNRGALLVSNTLSGLLAAAGLELDPAADYPGRFVTVLDGASASPIELPTSGNPIGYHFFRNLRLDGDEVVQVGRPREGRFVAFADYRARISASLGSALANARPYQPVVSLSSGYDSTAVAALAAEHGCRRAFTFRVARPRRDGAPAHDSGEATAHRLGMEAEVFDRLAYLARDDLAEAEFIATGMSGEDVVMSAYEPAIRRTVLLTGTQGNGVWRAGGRHADDASRSAMDGMSLHEFRLRRDFLFVPLPTFAVTERSSIAAISRSPEMRPWSVGGHYDQPISRRIAEEAGIARGSFAVRKRASSALLHSDGSAALAPATRASITEFAAAEGRRVEFPVRFHVRRWHRLVITLAGSLGAQRRVAGLAARRRRLVHFEPEIGTLLLRWAVALVRPRYDALRHDDV